MASIIFIGMDVHTTNFTLCAMNIDGYIFGEAQINPDVKELDKYLKTLSSRQNGDVRFVCGYEAGCLGYSLYHEITALGYECKILAPTTMAKSIDQKYKKNDHLDAIRIAQCLAFGTTSFVYIPTVKDDAVKEYIRMRDAIKANLKTIKQRIISFCTRHGKLYEKTYWTLVHIDWLRKLKFAESIHVDTLEEYLIEYERMTEKIARLDAKIEEYSQLDEYKEKVQKLRCFRGINTHIALSLVVEVGDFNRFRKAENFASYLGLTPGEHSSGNHNVTTGITKAGNTHLRCLLTESAQCCSRATVTKSKKLKEKQQGSDPAIVNYADRANDRLRRKYYRMISKGRSVNVAKTAIARELACFIWGMMTGNVA